jgi:hypothetical protein
MLHGSCWQMGVLASIDLRALPTTPVLVSSLCTLGVFADPQVMAWWLCSWACSGRQVGRESAPSSIVAVTG